MNDQATIEARREHLERHARVGVLIDRLRTLWTLCLYDETSGEYEAVDDSWAEGLRADLSWLQNLYAEAIAKEGDVSGFLSAQKAPRTTDARDVQ